MRKTVSISLATAIFGIIYALVYGISSAISLSTNQFNASLLMAPLSIIPIALSCLGVILGAIGCFDKSAQKPGRSYAVIGLVMNLIAVVVLFGVPYLMLMLTFSQ